MTDTRRDKRAPVSLKVRFKSASLDEFREQYSIDISRGGLFIKTKAPMPIGTLLKFEFQLKDSSRLIHGVGRVVWTRSPDMPADAPAGMGIKFIKMDPESRTLVQQIVDGRGDGPGRFEEGTEPTSQESIDFPDVGPAKAPALEDRTAVRHASEFLASALSAGGGELAGEAERVAEDARRRAAEREAEQARSAASRREAKPRGADGQIAAALEGQLAGVDTPEGEGLEGESSQAAPDSDIGTPSAGPDATPSAGQEAKALADDSKPSAAAGASDAPSARTGSAVTDRPSAEPQRRGAGSLLLWVLALGLLGGGAYVGLRQTGTLPGGPVFPAVAPAPPRPLAPLVPEAALPTEPEPEPEVDIEPELDAMASIRVESTPPGAEVRYEGEVIGTTPAELELPVGRQAVLTVDAPGYQTATVELVPAEDGEPVRVELERRRWQRPEPSEPRPPGRSSAPSSDAPGSAAPPPSAAAPAPSAAAQAPSAPAPAPSPAAPAPSAPAPAASAPSAPAPAPSPAAPSPSPAPRSGEGRSSED